MGYEVFIRSSIRVQEPMLSLFSDGRIGLNTAAVRVLLNAGVKNVLLLWDRANHKLALKAAPKSDSNSYRISVSMQKHTGTISAKAFIKHIGLTRPKRETVRASWNEKDKMLEAKLSAG